MNRAMRLMGSVASLAALACTWGCTTKSAPAAGDDGGGSDSSVAFTDAAEPDGDGVDSGMPAGEAGAKDTGAQDGSSGGDAGTPTPCTSAQTQFGLVAQGDPNPGFTSGVGVRTATQLLMFSGYNGPGPGPGADGGAVNLIYWQAFDPVTAASLGPAQPLALTDSTSLGYVYLQDVSIAPTGQIAILYTHIDTVHDWAVGLSAAFLSPASPTSDAGISGPVVSQVVQVESDAVGTPPFVAGGTNGELQGQAQAIWSTASGAFVFSYVDFAAATGVARVRKYLPNGAAAGGDTDAVPTGVPNAFVDYGTVGVGTSGSLFGVAFLNTADDPPITPSLTLLDALGNQVGTSLLIDDHQESDLFTGGYYWVTVAGTTQGFVVLSGTAPVTEFFVPVAADGGVGAVSDGGVATLPAGGPLPGFTFSGAQPAGIAHAISDDLGGPGGVGAVLLYSDGAHFIYVNADGVTHEGPNPVISHAFSAGDAVCVTQLGGSFGVALYSAAEHLTRMAASGCQ